MLPKTLPILSRHSKFHKHSNIYVHCRDLFIARFLYFQERFCTFRADIYCSFDGWFFKWFIKNSPIHNFGAMNGRGPCRRRRANSASTRRRSALRGVRRLSSTYASVSAAMRRPGPIWKIMLCAEEGEVLNLLRIDRGFFELLDP